MHCDHHVQALRGAADVLSGLIEIGVNLAAAPDRQQVFDGVLRQVRKTARAEAGCLYVLRKDGLQLVAAQNDRLDPSQVNPLLKEAEVSGSTDSLAGFVAATSQVVHVPDADGPPNGRPFDLSRHFEAAGYRTKSVLAVPLVRPHGPCLGVLELINRGSPEGRVVAFPETEANALRPLADMAAATIHHVLLQEELRASHLDTIMRLSVIVEERDHAATEHVRRVSQTAALLARALGLDDRTVELVECASPMHDIGKIGIPEAILHKTEPLTADERRAIEQHTVIGADILGQPENDLVTMAHQIALSHHERWDGKGYPYALAGKDIPVCGRIVALADAFDVLLAARCYKEAYTLAKVLIILQSERGKQFDPDAVDAFFGVLDDVLKAYGLEGVGANWSAGRN
jgi:GAF domain-containing protein